MQCNVTERINVGLMSGIMTTRDPITGSKTEFNLSLPADAKAWKACFSKKRRYICDASLVVGLIKNFDKIRELADGHSICSPSWYTEAFGIADEYFSDMIEKHYSDYSDHTTILWDSNGSPLDYVYGVSNARFLNRLAGRFDLDTGDFYGRGKTARHIVDGLREEIAKAKTAYDAGEKAWTSKAKELGIYPYHMDDYPAPTPKK